MKTLLYVSFNILIGQKATWVTPAAWPAGRGWGGSSHPAEGGTWRDRFCNWCLSLATWGQSGEKNDSGVIVIHSRLRFKVCPEGTLLFQAINGRPKRRRVWVCERNRRNDSLTALVYTILASLRCSALPQEAERLCPPALRLPRVSSAQELGVLKKKKGRERAYINKASSVLPDMLLRGSGRKWPNWQ